MSHKKTRWYSSDKRKTCFSQNDETSKTNIFPCFPSAASAWNEVYLIFTVLTKLGCHNYIETLKPAAENGGDEESRQSSLDGGRSGCNDAQCEATQKIEQKSLCW